MIAKQLEGHGGYVERALSTEFASPRPGQGHYITIFKQILSIIYYTDLRTWLLQLYSFSRHLNSLCESRNIAEGPAEVRVS